MSQRVRNHYRVGIAPISWMNDDIPGLGDHYTEDQVLSEMAALGYQSTEMGRLFMRDPSTLKKRLDQYQIELASKFVGTLFSDSTRQAEELQSFRNWVDYLKEMGSKYVIVCEIGGSMHWDPRNSQETVPIQKLTNDQWRTLVEGLHQAAELCQTNGMQLVYHYHAGTVIETREEIDRLMEMTDPDRISLLYDTGHALYGDYDPLELVKKYLDRIKYVHLKNVRCNVLEQVRREKLDFRTGVLKGLFTVPGDEEGCIDFEPIFQELLKSGYDGWWIVEAEQDPAVAHPYKYAKMAKDYIDSQLFPQQTNDLK